MTPSIHLDYDAVKEVVCTIWIARANYGKRELRPRERYENSALNPAHGTHASGVLFDDPWYASGLLFADPEACVPLRNNSHSLNSDLACVR